MVDVTSRLRLIVDSSGLDRAGKRLKTVRRESRELETAATRLRSTFATLGGVIGAAFSVNQIVRYADSFRNIENQLRLVTASTMELQRAQEGVLSVANETFASLDTTARLYANLERFAGQFLGSQQETLALTQAINQAALVSGASVSEASNAIRQLNQSIAGGVLRAEEFNSIMENLPRLGEAIADGLGASVGELRQLVNAGEVTSGQLIEAIRSQFEQLGSEAQSAVQTIDQAFVVLRNNLTVELGERFARAQDLIVDGILLIADNLDLVINAAEGVAAAFAVFAAPAALAAVTALISPIGLVAAAIAGVVAFRDDIAEWAFGVQDAGAVVQAAIDVLTPAFQAASLAVVDFAGGALEAFAQFEQGVTDAFGRVQDTLSSFFGSEFGSALLAGAQQAASQFYEIFKIATEAIIDLVLTIPRVLADAAGFLAEAFNLDFLENERAKLDAFADGVDALFGRELLDGIERAGAAAANAIPQILDSTEGTFEDIRARAQEIAAANEETAESFERQKIAAQATLRTTTQLSKASGARAAIEKEIAQNLQLAEAAALGEDEERIAREILNIRREIADISADEARSLAERVIASENELENARQLSAEVQNVFAGTDSVINNLWDQFVFQGQGAALEITDILNEAFRSLTGSFEDIFKSIGNDIGLTNFLGQSGDPLSLSSTLTAAFNPVTASGLGIGLYQQGFEAIQRLGIEGNRQSSLAGGAAGLAAGGLFAIPVIGPILGALGSLTGLAVSRPSNNVASANLDFGSGEISGRFNKTGANIDARNSFLENLIATTDLLESITGGTVSGGARVAVGSRDGTLVRTLDNQGNEVAELRTDDLEAAFAFAVESMLEDLLDGGSDAMADLALEVLNASDGAEALGENLSLLAQAAETGTPYLAEYAAALVSSGVSAQEASERLDGIGAILATAVDETERALTELAGLQADALSEAQTLFSGGFIDQAAFDQLNDAASGQLADFFSDVIGDALGANMETADLSQRLDDLADAAVEAGLSVERVSDALGSALGSSADALNSQIEADLRSYLDSPTDQLNELLEAQAERLAQAELLGADISQIERLTALELQSFFEGLSQDALDEVSSFLGLFEDATNTVVQNLDISRQDLRGQADAFEGFAQDFASLQADITDRFVAATPRENVEALQGRALELLAGVEEGNASAAQALPQVVNDLLNTARSTFGNTDEFITILDFAQGILSDAEAAAIDVQSEAERQIAALDENNDILADIRDILEDQDALLGLVSSSMSGGLGTSQQLIDLIQNGLGLSVPANDNGGTSVFSGVIGPLTNSLSSGLDSLSSAATESNALQRLVIDAVDRAAERIVASLDQVVENQDQAEILTRKLLETSEAIEEAQTRAVA